MKFVNKSGNKRVGIIVNKVNEVIHGPEFKARMLAHEEFNPQYTSSPEVTGAYIWLRMITDPSEIEVYTFKSKNPWTSSNGYTENDDKTRMFLNTRKFFRSDASIGGTIGHEGGHEIDNNDPLYFYGHGTTNTFKGNCVPEVIADIIYEIMSGMKSTESFSI